jgi:hypothetical protein
MQNIAQMKTRKTTRGFRGKPWQGMKVTSLWRLVTFMDFRQSLYTFRFFANLQRMQRDSWVVTLWWRSAAVSVKGKGQECSAASDRRPQRCRKAGPAGLVGMGWADPAIPRQEGGAGGLRWCAACSRRCRDRWAAELLAVGRRNDVRSAKGAAAALHLPCEPASPAATAVVFAGGLRGNQMSVRQSLRRLCDGDPSPPETGR